MFQGAHYINTIPKIIAMARQMPISSNDKVKANMDQLNKLHREMYTHLQSFIELGRKENRWNNFVNFSLKYTNVIFKIGKECSN